MILNDYLKTWDRNSDDPVISNIGLAVKIAKRFFNRSPRRSNLDILQQAMFGLFMASKRFDPERGTKFSTFATPYIRGYILQLGRTKRDKRNDAAVSLHLSHEQPLVQGSEEGIDVDDFLGRAMDNLSEREKFIVKMRYGLSEHGCMTLKEIGDRVHLSRERIRQIENVALKKMRKRTAFKS